MLNFTVGPVQSYGETLELGKEQVPYFRTEEFSRLMKENEKLIKQLFDCEEDGRSIFLTGSGTAGMEAVVINCFNEQDMVLVVNGGTFGQRFAQLCDRHNIHYEELRLKYGEELTRQRLKDYKDRGITGMLVQLCETSTGVLYNMDMIGEFCKEQGIFLCVDAVSGFLADKFSMQAMHVDVAITGSQKALALPPGMSIVVLNKRAVERVQIRNIQMMYFDFCEYLKDGERGQTPFTPAVSVLIQLNDRVKRIVASGGASYENRIIKERAEYFREKLQGLPLKIFVESKYRSSCVTAVEVVGGGYTAKELFNILSRKYGIWVCPNGGELAEKVFRVGHIGNITKEDIDKLIEALEDIYRGER